MIESDAAFHAKKGVTQLVIVSSIRVINEFLVFGVLEVWVNGIP